MISKGICMSDNLDKRPPAGLVLLKAVYKLKLLRFILLYFFGFFSSSICLADNHFSWKLMGSNKAADFYLMDRNVGSIDEKRWFYVLTDAYQPTNNGFKSIIYHFSGDCSLFKLRTVQEELYTKSMGRGDATINPNRSKTEDFRSCFVYF